MEPQQVITPTEPKPEEPYNPDSSEKYNSRDLTSMPYSVPQPQAQPAAGPTSQSPTSNNTQKKRGKLPKGPLIAGIVGGVLVIGLLVTALLLGGSNTKPAQTTTQPDSGQSQALQPAESVELEQANNALSQDLSRLDDEKDLPGNSLEDSALGL